MARDTGTVRDPARRDRILDAAAALIADRGYPGVSLAEIGPAAGIVGSGVYRHFESKGAILVELFDRIVDRLVADAEALLDENATAEQTLVALVADHVRFALDERTLCEIYVRESRHLPENSRRRLRWKQRHYVDLWQDLLRSVHPELTGPDAGVMVHAAISAAQSSLRFRSPLDDAELGAVLAEVSCRALRIDPAARAGRVDRPPDVDATA
jgi:AcrR family transcriptional regulator